MVELEMLLSEIGNKPPIDRLQTDRFKLENLRQMVCSLENIWIAEHQQRTARWTIDQTNGCFEHNHASAFRADQRAADMKTFLGQQRVEIITGDAPGNPGKTGANQGRILVPQFEQVAINFSASSTRADQALEDCL